MERPAPKLPGLGDRFQVRAAAGTGGMGTVYRAVDLLSGHEVAVKVLRESAGTPLQRFNREAALLAELSHPAIVRYVDHGVSSGGDRYLVMEWLDGETLDDRVARGGRLGVAETLALARRLLAGLAVAHAAGVVHRDLKPPNVFLPDLDLAQAKLLDFGVARRATDKRRLTSTGSTVGTPAYMSPEQVRGARTLDARSDLFSLAAVLYECLTAEMLFSAPSAMAVMTRIALEPVTSIAARRPELPANVADLLTRMLARNPDDRPASAGEVVRIIDDILEGLPAAAPAAPAPPRPDQIATAELRVVSAIVIGRAGGGDAHGLDRMGTWDVPTLARQAARHGLTDVFDDQAARGQLEEVVVPFGGRVGTFLGNALTVTLAGGGTPSDLAVQAARCVLAIKAMLPRVCFAVSTSRALVGDDALDELIAGGARLLSGAPPGAVHLDDLTATLLESRFEVLHGGGDPPSHQLLFEKGLREAPRTVLGRAVPCVGRDREVSALLGLWDEVRGEPVARAMLVTAPPGVGKTRLRHEVVERIQERGEPFGLLLGSGDAVHNGASYALLGPALRTAAGLVGGEPAEVQQKRLLTHVARHAPGPQARRVAAFLGEIAGVPFPDDDLPPLRAARQDPRLMADQTLGAWLDYIQAECAAHPVLLVLEDLQWGDVPSVNLVDAALRTLPDRPLLVLAFARAEVTQRFPTLWTERDLQQMALAPLTPRSAQRLVRAVLGELPPDREAWIVDRADGNPFYLEELVRAVGAGAGPGDALPDTVIGMVQARFDALGPEAKRVLRAASVFGSRFRPEGVSALAGDGDVERWLEILSAKEVVFPRPAADGLEYVFRHAIVEEAAYAMLTPEDCVLGHRLAGEYLERQGERDAIVLVDHFAKGEEPARAARWCRRAAEQALDANDLGAVLERVRRGEVLGATDEDLGAMWIIEAQARFWRGEFREQEEAAARAADGLTGVGRLRALAGRVRALGQLGRYDEVERLGEELLRDRPAPPATSAWLDCLIHVASYLLPGGRYAGVRAVLAEVEAGREQLERASENRLQAVQATLHWYDGNLARSVATAEMAAERYATDGDERSRCEMLANAAGAMAELGLLEAGEDRLCKALEAAERMQLGMVSACILMNLAEIRAWIGRLDAALSAARRAQALARHQGDPRIEAGAVMILSRVACLEGHFAEAESQARDAIALVEKVLPMVPVGRAVLARALLEGGQPGAALAEAEAAYRLVEELGWLETGEASVRLTYAECLIVAGRESDGASVLRDLCRRILERADRIEDPRWREAFLSNIPEHARAFDLARRFTPLGYAGRG